MRKPKIVGLAGIDKAIKSIANVGQNLNERVQDVAVAIVEHAAGQGNGDMSRALTLVKTVNRMRTLNAAFLVGYFRYFASTNINLRANDGAGKVSLMARDAKGYRGFDVDGARANNWYEAFGENGERSNWYAGPAPAEFQPLTVGDLAGRMANFVKNTAKLLTGTKDVNGKDVPVVFLSEGDRKQVENALLFIDRIAATLARHEDVELKAQELAKAQEALEQDNDVIEIIHQVAEQGKPAAAAK
jgi:hypothetical protein